MKLFTTLLFAMGCFSLSFSQTYTFSTFDAGYNNLVVPTSLNNGATWDDPDFTVPIGFSFDYFAEPTTSIQITSEGYGGDLKKDDCSVDPFESFLIAYGADIIDRGDDGTASLSNISHKTEGTVGSRICKVEWNNVGFYYGSVDANGDRIDYMNFQLWFYETTNVIEIRFGPKSISEPLVDFEGETGTFITLLHKYDCTNDEFLGHQLFLGGNPSSPTFYDDDFSVEDSVAYMDGVIPAFTVYQFTPALTTSQEEISSKPSFSVVPNPAKDELKLVQDENTVSEIRHASIVDVNGKVLLSNLTFNQEISISDLESGIYFVQIELESGESFSEKFTKL